MRFASGEFGAGMDAIGIGAGEWVAGVKAEAAAGRGAKP